MASWKSLAAREILESAQSAWREAFAQAAIKYREPSRKTHKIWTTRFDDLALYDQGTFTTKLNYIHQNPIKTKLTEHAEDYPAAKASAGTELALQAVDTSGVLRAEQRDKAQTALAMVFPGPSRQDHARSAAEVWAAVAGGLGGRLFEILRSQQSLAYTVVASSWQRHRAGALLACPPAIIFLFG